MSIGTEDFPSVFTIPTEQRVCAFTHENENRVNDVYLQEPSSDAQALLELYSTTGYSQHTIPAFFEQIMVSEPDFLSLEYMQPPPDLASWMPEAEWLGQVDIFGNDFTPAIDQIFEAQAVPEPFVPDTAEESRSYEARRDKIDDVSARKRHAVFKQSPWCVLFRLSL
jgi:hypothetical protein